MIKLQFIINREMMIFVVKDKEIFYQDKIFSKGLRCIPKDENFTKIIVNSRNKYPKALLTMFNLPEEERKEYEELAPQGEKVLADRIIKDCLGKGLTLLKREAT